MPTEIKMPQLGESVHEGTIGKWLKRPGDAVAKYEPLVEVITDKVNVEMPSPFAGVLGRILVQEGQTVAAGTVIALIEERAAAAASGVSPGAPPPAQRAPEPAVPASARAAPGPAPAAPPAGHDGAETGPQAPPRTRPPRFTPLVRQLAAEHRISMEELATIEGSGAGGRITKDDILHYLGMRSPKTPPAPPAAEATPTGVPVSGSLRIRAPGAGAVPSAAVSPAPPAGTVSPPPAPAAPRPAPEAAPARAPGDELHALSPIRRTIAERMARSVREIPHAYGTVEVDMTALVRHREAHKASWRAREGVNVSVTAFIVRAAARALRAFPQVNSTFAPEGILYKGAVNIGVGVAFPDGLVVPVVKNADTQSVLALAREIEALAGRARQGTLTLDDVSGGTFTLTNAGVFGSIFSMPIINYPQAAILSADAIVRRPVVVGEGIAVRDVMHLGLAFDHRIFDGAVAMQFLGHIKRQLEEFSPRGDSPEF
jgi:2-oxoisovalerate dehydrogenase E2 component (dihydrolipoyl transacylase)